MNSSTINIPAFANGSVYIWRPVGLDPSLLMPHLLVGARVYAIQKANGASEERAHIEAEKSAFMACYDVSY